jgi:ribosomal protein S18 acetylase RimI-like enzyme
MQYRIRLCVTTDREAITGLVKRLSDFDMPGWRIAEQVDETNIAMVNRAMDENDPSEAILVAEHEGDGKVVGFIRLQTQTDYFSKSKQGYIANIAVAEEYEGQGIGREFMMAAEIWAREKGYDQLTLHVFVENERARQVYENNGYHQDVIKYVKVLDGNS